MFKRALVVAAFVLAGSVSAYADQPAKVAVEPISAIDAERHLLADIQQHADDDDENGLRELIKVAVASPAFASLPTDTQHRLYYLLGVSDADAGDNKEALAYAKKLTAMDEATAADWKLMLRAAYPEKDAAAEADALVVITNRWPTALADYLDKYYAGLFRRLANAKDFARRTELLNAFDHANWRPIDHIADFSILWFWLAEVRLDANDLLGARAAAKKVDSDYVVLRMRNDKRFDAITSADPQRFDPVAMAKQRLKHLQDASAAEPDRIEGPYFIAVQLMTLERNEEALAIVDTALKKALTRGDAAPPYKDVNDYIIWVMDTRSRLLRRLGRLDDAIAQERQVAQYAENGGLNVSQLLNLGDLLQVLGRPKESLEVVNGAELRDVSPFGRMVLMQVRVCADEQLHDVKSVNDALDFMRAHAADGRSPLRDALLCVDDQAGVANQLLHDLADPDARDGALMDMQTFDQPPTKTANERLIDERFEAVKIRPDVQAAANAVGHINAYPLNAPLD